jgi:hypothetical protein
MDNLSKKLASNDKMLETISNKMESFSFAIKNQHSFNKMLESQISQLASSVPTANPGKIPGQPEELEYTNLVDIYSADLCSSKTEEGQRWIDWGMPAKRGDPGRPIITITIGAYTFKNALCDFGSSVNIMPKVISEDHVWFEDQWMVASWCDERLTMLCGLGLVRGTRWPAESSAGCIVARIVGQSCGRFLGWASKPRSSRDYVGAESLAIGGGFTEFAGFAAVHRKTTRLLG